MPDPAALLATAPGVSILDAVRAQIPNDSMMICVSRALTPRLVLDR